MPFLGTVNVEQTVARVGETYSLVKPLTWISPAPRKGWIDKFTTPAGAATDFASFPHWLPFSTSLLGDPHRVAWAAIPHDFGYAAAGLHPWSREQVDRMFLEILIEIGAKPWRAKLMHRGVRSGGWIPWNRHLKRNGGGTGAAGG